MPQIRRDAARLTVMTVPTPAPESDGTFTWSSTSVIVLELTAGDRHGLGYGYASPAAAKIIAGTLLPAIDGRDIFDVPQAWTAMAAAVRNVGRPGVASMAISIVDTALWDLKARLLDVSLARLWGLARTQVDAYASGGFTSQSVSELTRQLGGWAERGFRMVKMKVGRDADADRARVGAARQAVGDSVALFVDANGAYARKQALAQAEAFADHGVVWFEEPVSSDDLDGLRLLRDRAPAGMDIAAGEYGFDQFYFRRMLSESAVDVLQADATRCAGPTGFLRAAALCEAWAVPLSAHTAPALHAHLGCALAPVTHVEYFADHARIEDLIFHGAPQPVDGRIAPDLDRPGLGLEFLPKAASRYAA